MTAQAIEAGTGETRMRLDAKHESAVRRMRQTFVTHWNSSMTNHISINPTDAMTGREAA